MKQVIRFDTFETNSSSMHSLVYSNKDRGYDYDLPVDENGILTIPFGEYEWGPGILRTPIEKLSYLITEAAGTNYYDSDVPRFMLEQHTKVLPRIIEIFDIVKKKCPKVKDFNFEFLDEYSWPRGSIDHQSQGTCAGEHGKDLEKLIFSNSVIILIDNDNSSHYDDYYESENYEPLFESKRRR